MTPVLIVLGLLLALIGLAAGLVPILPGPTISYLSLLVLSFAHHWQTFSVSFLVVLGVLAVAVSLSDTVFSLIGAKRYGSSKSGIWGSIIGMTIGFFFIPPFGVFVGAVVGALFGELIAGKTHADAMRAGWGVIVGNLLSLALKVGYGGMVLFFYIKALF